MARMQREFVRVRRCSLRAYVLKEFRACLEQVKQEALVLQMTLDNNKEGVFRILGCPY